MAVLVVAGGVVYAMLMSSTTLLAKNLSLNSSNTLTRAALDRMYAELNQANRLPTLVDDTKHLSPTLLSRPLELPSIDMWVALTSSGILAQDFPQRRRLSNYSIPSIRWPIRRHL